MGFNHTVQESFKFAVAGSPGTYTATPQFTEWVQLGAVGRNATLIALAGELDEDCIIEVYEATDALGTDAQELTDVTTGETFVNGTDEGGFGLITVRDDSLTDGFQFVSAYVTPGSTDVLAMAWMIGGLYDMPADNSDAAFEVYD